MEAVTDETAAAVVFHAIGYLLAFGSALGSVATVATAGSVDLRPFYFPLVVVDWPRFGSFAPVALDGGAP